MTTGTVHAGSSRYAAGSAKWSIAAVTIASATGHQRSPRAAA
ncbi:hypothetical protein ABZW10_30115 [Kitasatospora sp. NPDC004723]